MLELFDFFQQLLLDVFGHETISFWGTFRSRALLSKTDAIRNGKTASAPQRNGSEPFKKEYESEGWGTASLTIIRRFLGAVGVEEALQNQYGSDLIDDLAMTGGGAAGGVQMAVRFGGG